MNFKRIVVIMIAIFGIIYFYNRRRNKLWNSDPRVHRVDRTRFQTVPGTQGTRHGTHQLALGGETLNTVLDLIHGLNGLTDGQIMLIYQLIGINPPATMSIAQMRNEIDNTLRQTRNLNGPIDPAILTIVNQPAQQAAGNNQQAQPAQAPAQHHNGFIRHMGDILMSMLGVIAMLAAVSECFGGIMTVMHDDNIQLIGALQALIVAIVFSAILLFLLVVTHQIIRAPHQESLRHYVAGLLTLNIVFVVFCVVSQLNPPVLNSADFNAGLSDVVIWIEFVLALVAFVLVGQSAHNRLNPAPAHP
ncbi:MAG TPA: hypothetical protein VG965_02375 [Patescibacteria group bacterium]|nr:hypothetical protein [Patescibacteria group bacterium]